MADLPFRSATELAAEIRAKRIGCRELLELYLARVERFNPKLNAIIFLDAERARVRADAADAALAKGEVWGPLHGVPMTIKESYEVSGTPTTWGLMELKGNIATKNAVAVDRLIAAGVVLFGKTNVPVMLADWQTFNPVYGTTNNPWDVTRSPGGSSGGSAAALAAGLTAIEAGSDIGASIRNPAHFCGVYGHKPSWNIVTMRGHALPGRVAQSDISVVGPLARSAADLETAFLAMAGPDEIDGAGWRLDLPPPRATHLAGFKVAVLLDDKNGVVDRAVQDRIQDVADFLARAGAKVSDAARPAIDTTEAYRVFITLLRSATSGRQSEAEFAKSLERMQALAPDDESYFARMVRGNTLHHRDWLAANETRHRMRLKWAEFFREWDLLLCPAASSAATPHDQKGERYERMITVNGAPVPSTDQMFWAGYTGAFYLPSTVAPAGLTPVGLPVGIQIVGPQYGDLSCLALAHLLECEHGGFVAPPGYE
jgi:amidase